MAKEFTSEQGYRPRDLLHASIDHLDAAQILFEHGPRTLDSAGYLSHLGIELLLKALLLDRNDRFPSTHDLHDLLSKVEESGALLDLSAEHLETVALLDQFSSLRYPLLGGSPPIGSEHWRPIHLLRREIILQSPALKAALSDINPTEKFGRVLLRKPKNPAA